MTTTAGHTKLSACEIIVGVTDESAEISAPISQTEIEFVLESGKTVAVRIVETNEKYCRDSAYYFTAVLVVEPFTRYTGWYNPLTRRGILNRAATA